MDLGIFFLELVSSSFLDWFWTAEWKGISGVFAVCLGFFWFAFFWYLLEDTMVYMN
jgi:hypothetical protein